MATLAGNQVKLDNGQLVTPQQGAWYDGQQYWGGTLSKVGQINSLSDQQGAGQDVSEEINRQTSIAAGLKPSANQDYINSKRNRGGTTGGGATGVGATPSGGSSGVSLAGGAASTINLMENQQKLYEASGISNVENQIASIQATIDAKKSEADKRRAEVNENPFLSESSRVGRIAKIDQALNDTLMTDEARLNTLKADVAAKKAEINEKLGIQVQQYNIDKAARQENFQMFNTLLSSGALASATPEDLAILASQAGVPVSFIQSAIQASQKADVQIVTETDNYGNVTILTIDKNTGDIVNQTSAGRVGKGSTGSGISDASYRGAILDAATTVDQKYKTVDGKLVTGTVRDEFGVEIGDYSDAGDKLLSQQEYEKALDLAYANAGASFKGTRTEFAQIFDQTLIDNGFSSWGN